MRTEFMSEDRARELLPPTRRSLLNDAFVDSIADWHDILKENPTLTSGMTPRTRASFIHDRAVQRLREVEATGLQPWLRVRKQNGLWLAGVEGELFLKLKKLDPKLRSSNIRTDQTRLFDANAPLFNVPSSTNATSGYVLDELTASPIRLVVVCRIDGDQKWTIDLRDGDEGAETLELPVTPKPPMPGTKRTRPRRTKPEQEVSESDQP